MSLQDKIKNAEKTMWPAEGIPKWKVKWIIFWSQLKARIKVEKIFYNYKDCFLFRFPLTNTWFRYKKRGGRRWE